MIKKQHIKALLRGILFGGMFLLSACSGGEEPEMVSTDEVKLGIELPATWKDDHASRATIVDKEKLATDGFGVFTFYQQDFMNNTKVTSTNKVKR